MYIYEGHRLHTHILLINQVPSSLLCFGSIKSTDRVCLNFDRRVNFHTRTVYMTIDMYHVYMYGLIKTLKSLPIPNI
jgi:hypothetical protein